MSLADTRVRRHPVVRPRLEFLASPPFEDPQALQDFPGPFRIWVLRLACGLWHSVQYTQS